MGFGCKWDVYRHASCFLAVFCMIFANLYACHSTQILLLPCSDWLQRLQIFDWEYRPACLPACLLACLVPCLLACLLACLPACLRACLLPCLLARLGSSRGVAQGSRSATFRFCLKLLLVCTCSVSCMVPYYVIRILSNKHIAHGCLHTQYPDGIPCWDTLWGVTISHRCPMVISVFHKLQHMFVNGGVWWWCCFLPTTQRHLLNRCPMVFFKEKTTQNNQETASHPGVRTKYCGMATTHVPCSLTMGHMSTLLERIHMNWQWTTRFLWRC